MDLIDEILTTDEEETRVIELRLHRGGSVGLFWADVGKLVNDRLA